MRIAVVEQGADVSGVAIALAPAFGVVRIDTADAASVIAGRDTEFGACVIDADLAENSGVALAERIVTACPRLPAILFGAVVRRENAAVASRLGVPLLVLPVGVSDVREALNFATAVMSSRPAHTRSC